MSCEVGATSRYKRPYRAVRDRFFVALIHLARAFLHRLGLERALRLADGLALPLPWLLLETRRLTLEHLEMALPELDRDGRERVVRGMFRSLARSVVEVLLLDDVAARLTSFVEAEGLEVMDEALSHGRGVIAITGHIGNWELLAAFFGLRGYPVTVIATPVKGARLNAENIAVRRGVSVETVMRDGPGASREILRTLKRGRILAILMDQDTRGQGVVVPFFGRSARTPVGPALLALRTGARVVGVFIHRLPDGRHRVVVRPADLPAPPGDDRHARDRWLVDATARLTSLIEGEVRARPEEWVWWHRRWRARARPTVDLRVTVENSLSN